MESITPILHLKVGDALITVDEDLQLHWHGAFHLGIAAHSMQLIEDLLCLYGDCQQRQPPRIQDQEQGWIEFSTLYHGTRLLQSRLDRQNRRSPGGRTSSSSSKCAVYVGR